MFGRSVREGKTPPRGRFAVVAILLAVLLASSGMASMTFDLLHDSPETRKALKEELERTALPADAAVEKVPAAHDELEKIWFARERFIQIGEAQKARKQLDILREKQTDLGIRNLPAYSEILVREARRLIRRGNLREAEEILTVARQISPDYLSAYFASAALVIKEGFWNVLSAGREIVKGFKAIDRSFLVQSWALANLFILASTGIALFFALFIAFMLLKNAGLVVHDIAELLPRTLALGPRKVLGWLLFLAPLIVGFPVWWWLILSAMLLWPYIERLPKVVLMLAVLYLFSFPVQVRLLSSLLSMQRQPTLNKIVAIREDHWDLNDYNALKVISDGGTTDPEVHFTVGLAARRTGDLEAAVEAYNKALRLQSSDAALWNNLGNLAFVRSAGSGLDEGQEDALIDEAIAHYLKAIEIDPGSFAPHYNLSLAYRRRFLFAEGEAESRRAVKIDPEANAYYTGLSGSVSGRDTAGDLPYTVDELPSMKALWAMALQENKWQKATADHLWNLGMFLAPRELWPYTVGSILLLGLGYWAVQNFRGTAQNCTRCGRIYCQRCRGRTGGSLCSQCHHIFVRKEGVEARVKVRKMAEIKRRGTLGLVWRLFTALLLPGGGHIVTGRYAAGTLFSLPAALLLAWFFFARDSFPAIRHLQLTPGMVFVIVLALAYLAWWGLSLWLAFRLEE